MRTDLARRLSDLEERGRPTAAPRCLSAFTRLQLLLIAYHLGGLTESESIAQAEARALGYDGPAGMRFDLQRKAGGASSGWDQRHTDAISRLLRSRGVSPNDGPDAVGHALGTLYEDMPDWVRAKPFADGMDALFDTSAEWICL